MTDVPDGCTLVTEPYWPCEDIWPPGTLSKAAIAAYKRLQQHGQITIERVFYNKQTDVTRFIYLSMESGDTLKSQLQNAMREGEKNHGAD